ncbi:tubulin-like doman-containing protein [Niveispirillum sp.]|uniref:tubulin-like doman-containing protein n=1 Tax=Niveispirillum sp. TaxID=1917217 RepID=UPI001B7728F4|nr:tubulin-like doman-containing protein [Niveispirillum sp.]MBP7335166.1 hypothetical protein [Niveispirillum sp.]
MANDTKKSPIKQRPTLLIGMGGTGKQVLLQLRRMFLDHHGVSTFGHIGHLWVDTDTRNRTLDGEELGWFYEQVNFQARETVPVELTKSDLKIYFTERKHHANIYAWLDPSLERHGEISDGAAQIRMFGRLAFFKHYGTIRKALRSALDDIRNSAGHLEVLKSHNIEVDASRTDAWLIFSVAGGTGSGMFLDMAFALKQLDPNITIRGIIVLPSVFTRDYTHKIYGNAYAALMELEHYNFAKQGDDNKAAHQFPVMWTMDQFREKQSLRGPVFEMAYLIGNKPDSPIGELRVDQKTALCDMLAESLFVELGGKTTGLAAEWASRRSNLQDSLTSVVRMTYHGNLPGYEIIEEFSCRYGSFGLSKLHVPIQRVAALVRHRLAEEMVGHWTQPAPIPNNFDTQIAKEIHERLLMRVGDGAKSSLFVRELGRGPTGDSLEQILKNKVEQRRSEFVRSAGNPDVAPRLTEWFQSELLRGQLDTSHPDRTKWGALTRLIVEQHLEGTYIRITGELDKVVAEMVNTHGQRFTLTRELLRRLTATIDTARLSLVNQSQRARTQSERRRRDLALRLSWLPQTGGQFTRQTIVDVAVDFASDALVQELRAQIYDAAAALCERLTNLIGRGVTTKDADGKVIILESGLLKQLSKLEDDLIHSVRPLLRNHVDSLRQLPDSPINISLLEERDINDFYTTREGKPIDETAMADLSRRFFEETTETGGGLWQMRDTLGRDGPGKAGERIVAFARRATPHLEERTVDAIDRFARKFPVEGAEYRTMLRRLSDNGMPWLAEPTHHVSEGEAFRYKKQEIILGTSSRSPETTRNVFVSKMQDNYRERLVLVDSPADRVYVNSECAGIPLVVTPDLDLYRNQSYYTHLKAGLALHIDVNFEKFQDILVRSGDEPANYIEALRVLGLGLLASVVRAKVGPGDGTSSRIELQYTDRSSLMNEQMDLGPVKLALRRLTEQGGESLRASILADVERRTNAMSVTEQARWLVLLRYHGRFNPTGHDALSRVMDRVAASIEQEDEALIEDARGQRDTIREWAVERPPNSGIFCLPAKDRLEF